MRGAYLLLQNVKNINLLPVDNTAFNNMIFQKNTALEKTIKVQIEMANDSSSTIKL